MFEIMNKTLFSFLGAMLHIVFQLFGSFVTLNVFLTSGIVSVISSKFGTEQTRSTFSLTPESENPSKEQEIISAVYCNGKMVISLSKSIIAIECNVSSSCLAAALGKLKRFFNIFFICMLDRLVSSNYSEFFRKVA